MQVKDVMTKDVEVIPGRYSIVEVAKIMKEMDIGAIPVGDQQKVDGIITDRDIVLKVIAEGKALDQCTAKDVMTSPIQTIEADCDIEEAQQLMADKQVRRLVVVDENQKPIGMLALGDLATKSDENLAGQALQQVSEPSHPRH